MEKLYVVKIGGNVIDEEKKLEGFLKEFSGVQAPRILVHGGGKIATRIGEQLGIQSKYINGRRITDGDTIDLVTMVYGGLVNKKIVAKLQSLKCNAIGLTGADANLMPAVKRPVKETDFGWVGDIPSEKINMNPAKAMLQQGWIPVVAPLTHDGQGHILNTNADTIASVLATGLSGYYDVRLIYCFEKKGVLEDVQNEESVVPLITKDIYSRLKAENRLFEGILPKIDNAFAAINAGVKEVLIGHADDLVTNTGSATKGTLIR